MQIKGETVEYIFARRKNDLKTYYERWHSTFTVFDKHILKRTGIFGVY